MDRLLDYCERLETAYDRVPRWRPLKRWRVATVLAGVRAELADVTWERVSQLQSQRKASPSGGTAA